MTKGTFQLLQIAYSIDANDDAACFFADITLKELNEYQAKHPEFVEQKKLWKSRLALKALATLYKAIGEDPEIAMWYLEHKMPEEFGRH